MRIFRWWCWLRGYHKSSYYVQKLGEPNETDGGRNTFGCAGGCYTCGKIPNPGALTHGLLAIEWQ